MEIVTLSFTQIQFWLISLRIFQIIPVQIPAAASISIRGSSSMCKVMHSDYSLPFHTNNRNSFHKKRVIRTSRVAHSAQTLYSLSRTSITVVLNFLAGTLRLNRMSSSR